MITRWADPWRVVDETASGLEQGQKPLSLLLTAGQRADSP
jgi:hypothetical protein